MQSRILKQIDNFGLLFYHFFMKILKSNYFIFCIFFLIYGLYCVTHGFDNTYEFKLYHLWNGYSFANKRLLTDFAFIGNQNYFNPFFDYLYYFLYNSLRKFPYLFLFLQGFCGACVVFPLYKIINLIICKDNFNKFLCVICCIFLASGSFNFVLEIGTSMLDLQVCSLPLFGLYFILKGFYNSDNNTNYKLILLSGIFFGMSAGLKLTMCLHILALFIVLIINIKCLNNPVKTFCFYALGCFWGFIITDGYWAFLLWKEFQNPFFPFYNNIFRSQYAEPLSCVFKGRFPNNITEYLFYPYFFATGKQIRASEFLFTDFRWILGYTSLIGYIFIICIQKFNFIKNINYKFNEFINLRKLNFLIIFVLCSYLIWISSFCNTRYGILIELLFNIIIISTIYYICLILKAEKIFNVFLILVTIFIHITTTHLNVKVPLDKYLQVEDMHIPDNATVLSYGMPTGFAAVFQNPKAKYVYGTTDAAFHFSYSEKSKEMVKNLLEGNKDNIYAIWAPDGQFRYPDGYKDLPPILIPDYNIDLNSCRIIYNSHDETIGLCRINKI